MALVDGGHRLDDPEHGAAAARALDPAAFNESLLKGHDIGYLFLSRRLRGLRVPDCRVHGLMLEAWLASIPHHRREKTQIGGRQRPPIQRQFAVRGHAARSASGSKEEKLCASGNVNANAD